MTQKTGKTKKGTIVKHGYVFHGFRNGAPVILKLPIQAKPSGKITTVDGRIYCDNYGLSKTAKEAASRQFAMLNEDVTHLEKNLEDVRAKRKALAECQPIVDNVKGVKWE